MLLKHAVSEVPRHQWFATHWVHARPVPEYPVLHTQVGVLDVLPATQTSLMAALVSQTLQFVQVALDWAPAVPE